MIPLNNIWWFSQFPPPPPPCLHFPSKFDWSPLWILPTFSVILLLGSQLRLIPPFVLLKIKRSAQKSPPPPHQAINNDRSLIKRESWTREVILGRRPGYVNFTKVIFRLKKVLFLRRPHILINCLKCHQIHARLYIKEINAEYWWLSLQY